MALSTLRLFLRPGGETSECYHITWTHQSQWATDSAGNQSEAGFLPRPSMKRVRRRDRGSLKARAWFHWLVCSRPIGAGDPSQDARGERRRGEERGESADGKVSRARLTRKQGHRPRFSLSWTTRRWEIHRKGHFEIWWGLFLVGNSTMIWYVATLIASVFSTRGTAAQGESKCSVCVCPPAHIAQVLTKPLSPF